jgi:hypothetical protein
VRGWAAAGPPRSGRDWLVDTAAFLLAAGFGFGLSLLRISDGTVPEIALAVGEGRPNAEIGGQLYLSVPTVKTHISRILTKLDLNNRVQIALLVHDAGLLRDED